MLIPQMAECVIHKIYGTNQNGTDRKPRWRGRYRTHNGVVKSYTRTATDLSDDACARTYTEVVDQLWHWYKEDIVKWD